MKTLLIFLVSFFAFSQAFAIAPITGDSSVCQGLTAIVTDSTPGGTWSSSNPAIAAIGSSTGIVTGLSVGTVLLTYTVGSGFVIRPFNIYPLYPISGPGFLCTLFGLILTNPAPSGVWTSSDSLSLGITYAFGTTIDTAAIIGIAPGIDTIFYTLPTGCTSMKVITVSPSPIPILGLNHVCAGTSGTLSDAVSGGVWSSSAPAIATIGTASGVDAGIALGVTNITYTLGPGCYAVMPLTVNPVPGAIAGPSTVCALDSILLTNADAGGIWSSSNTAVATAGTTFGNVTGVSAGVATISYYFDPTCYVTMPVTVNPAPMLSSPLTATFCSGFLFTYVPSGTMPGTTFTWSRAAVPGISNPAATGTGTISETLISTSASPVVVTYSYFMNGGGCFNTQSVLVTVNPIPSLSSSLTPPDLCDSTIFNYTPMSGITGTLFTWGRAAISGILEAATSGAGNPNEQLINTSTLPLPVSYVYALSASGCSNLDTVTVTVNPTPLLSSTFTPPSQCNTLPFNYLPTSATPGVTDIWNRSPILGITPPSSSGSGSISEYITNTTTGPINVSYYIRLSVDGCANSFAQGITFTLMPCSALLGVANSLTPEAQDISPNPTTGEINITGLNGASSLKVFNLLGQGVLSTTLSKNNETVDIRSLSQGIYIFRVQSANGLIENFRIVKE